MSDHREDHNDRHGFKGPDEIDIRVLARGGSPGTGKFLNSDGVWADPAASGPGTGAPTTSDYLVGTSDAALSNEIVVGTTPGGELGGTWAAPTIDAIHSGSSHAQIQAAAEATANGNLNAHLVDTVDAHDASAVSVVPNPPGLTATDVQHALEQLATTIIVGPADRGIQIVNSLPALPDSRYPQGIVVFLTTDNKLYRSTGTAWTAAVPTVDLTGQVQTAQIVDAAINAAKLALLAVGSIHLQDAAVLSAKIADNQITTAKIVADAITAAQIASGAVGQTELVDGAVITAKLADNAVLQAKIADGAVARAKIVDDAIDASKLANGAVDTAAIQPLAITATQIADNTITTGKIGANQVQANNIQAGAVVAGKLAAGSVQAGNVAAGAIQAGNIAAGGVTAGTIAADAVTATEIAAGAVSANELAANSVVAGKIAAGTIQAVDIGANVITANEIAAGAIQTSELAAGAVQAGNIAAGAIQAGHISAGAVTAGAILADSVTTVELAANAVHADNVIAGAIQAGKLAAGAVQAGNVAAGAIQAGNIDALAVQAGNIAAGAIRANDIAAGQITTDHIVAGTIQAADIASNVITANEIAANAIQAAELAAINLEVGKFLRSNAYTPGVTGWSIDAAGNAEFANALVRGTVDSSYLKTSVITGVVGTNLIPNPGAEIHTGGWNPVANTTITRDTTVKRTGAASFKLTATADATIGFFMSSLACQPGVAYSLVAFVRGATAAAAANTVQVEIQAFDAANNYIQSWYTQGPKIGSTVWRSIQISTRAGLPANAAYLTAVVYMLGALNGQALNVDDLVLQPISSMYASVETGPPGAPTVQAYSDAYPHVVLGLGIDGESGGHLYRWVETSAGRLDYTGVVLGSGYMPGQASGDDSSIAIDARAVVSPRERTIRLNTNRAYVSDGGAGDVALAVHTGVARTTWGSVQTSNTAAYLQVPASNTVTFRKRHVDTQLLFRISLVNLYVGTGPVSARFSLGVGGGPSVVDVTQVQVVAGVPRDPSGEAVVANLATGTYTFAVYWKTSDPAYWMSVDANSLLTLSVTEVSA